MMTALRCRRRNANALDADVLGVARRHRETFFGEVAKFELDDFARVSQRVRGVVALRVRRGESRDNDVKSAVVRVRLKDYPVRKRAHKHASSPIA